MMIDINDIKNGMTVIVEGNLYQIVVFYMLNQVKVQHS